MIQAINDKIVVKIPEIDKLDSGLYLPDGQKEAPDQWLEVVSIGDKITSDIKIGDRVYPDGNKGGVLVIKNGVKYVLLKEDHVYAIERD